MSNSGPPPAPLSFAVEQESRRQEQDIPPPPPPPSLDELIEMGLGSFGWTQFLQAILVSMPLFFDAQQTLISVFADAKPTWHCANSADHNNNNTCSSGSDNCHLPRNAWDWDGPSYRSVISDWGLECATSFVAALPASSFFAGCLVGGFILASLGDSVLGRKCWLFLSCFTMSVAGLSTLFSPSFWVYSSLRFVTGCFRSAIVTCSLVLLTETVGKRQRSYVSVTGFFCFSLGLLSLPAIAYFNRNSSWRLLYLWTSVPGIFYCVVAYFLVSESPRWLFIRGRQAEAMAVLKRLSSSTTSDFPLVREAPDHVDNHSSMKKLITRRWALQRLLGTMGLAFGIGMAYYGLLLGVGNLDFNIYLTVTLNGLLDLPAYFLTLILTARSRRRVSILACCILSGSLSIICAVSGDNHKVLQIGSELASILSVCVAFNLLLIYTTELFPTSIRNSAASIVRQALMCAAIFDPILVSVGRKNKLLSYGVFGAIGICCGFSVTCLPETKGVALSDTLDEQEEKDKLAL